MQSFLKSTIPNAKYTDNSGITTEYSGNTVEQLLLVDLAIRNDTSGALNKTSLEKGIEHEISNLMTTIFEMGQKVVLTAEFETSKAQNADKVNLNTTIVLTNSETPLNLNLDLKSSPEFEKHLKIKSTTKENPESSEAVIKLYLI